MDIPQESSGMYTQHLKPCHIDPCLVDAKGLGGAVRITCNPAPHLLLIYVRLPLDSFVALLHYIGI